MKSRFPLLGFVNYCMRHPDLRFWQALASWSGYTILAMHASQDPTSVTDVWPRVKDTFYWVKKHG